MYKFSKRATKLLKIIYSIDLVVFALLTILTLWKLVHPSTLLLSFILLMNAIFLALFTFQNQNLKFTIPGILTMTISYVGVVKFLDLKFSSFILTNGILFGLILALVTLLVLKFIPDNNNEVQ